MTLDVLDGQATLAPSLTKAWQEQAILDHETWRAVVGATVAASRGDRRVHAGLNDLLNQLVHHDTRWRPLANVLQRIVYGDYNPTLAKDLDSVSQLIVDAVLRDLLMGS
jgi:hypothetical protein